MNATFAKHRRSVSIATLAVATMFVGMVTLSGPADAARKSSPSPTPTQTTEPTFPTPEPTKTYPAGWQTTEPGIDPQN